MEGMAAIHSKEMKEFSIYLLIVNIFTFIVYGVDKLKAKEHWWRISEATLLFLAVVGGSVGAWVGMKVWHHKTMPYESVTRLRSVSSNRMKCIQRNTPLSFGVSSHLEESISLRMKLRNWKQPGCL